MRQLAFSRGMQVNICQIPGTKPGQEVVNGACYRLQNADRKHSFEKNKGSFVRVDDYWILPPQASQKLQKALSKLPKLVSVASIENNSCAVYWQEDGDSEDVEKIYSVLTVLLEILE